MGFEFIIFGLFVENKKKTPPDLLMDYVVVGPPVCVSLLFAKQHGWKSESSQKATQRNLSLETTVRLQIEIRRSKVGTVNSV